jgi:hypothetical protein
MFFTRKKRSTPISGDIEMLTIPSSKRLGNKHVSRLLPKSMTKFTLRSSNSSSKNASIASTSAKRIKRFNAKQIYMKRVRYSRCRSLSKSACKLKRSCKFTKGKTRKYCRKKYNKRI